MYNIRELFKLSDTYYQGCQKLIKVAFIKKLPGGKWQVLSHKGKSLGTYNTKDEAVTRLRQVEYFKKHDQNKGSDSSSQDSAIDLTEIDDFSYSAVMRKIRQKASK